MPRQRVSLIYDGSESDAFLGSESVYEMERLKHAIGHMTLQQDTELPSAMYVNQEFCCQALTMLNGAPCVKASGRSV